MTVRQTIAPAPVVKTVRVKAAPSRAFEVFAASMGKWWPRSHSVGDSPLVDVRLEPRSNGRWYGALEDGTETDWGRVLAWEPPGRLLLAWQLSADWTYDPDLMTEVEVTFAADGDGALVTLEHRDLDRYGARAEEIRGMIGSQGGWPAILASYAALADG